jgi:hypothetical protein
MARDLSHMRSLAMLLAMLSLPLPLSALAARVVANPKAVPTKAAPSRPPARARSDAHIEKDIRQPFRQIGNWRREVHGPCSASTRAWPSGWARLGGASAVPNHIEISEAAQEKRLKTWKLAAAAPRSNVALPAPKRARSLALVGGGSGPTVFNWYAHQGRKTNRPRRHHHSAVCPFS